MSYDYFCYDPDTGFKTYNTPEGAKQAAEDAIDYYRDNADEGWNEEVRSVCWGKINQRTVETLSLSIKEAENQGIFLPKGCGGFSDYGLIDALPDNHDRLVEENKRLRSMLESIECILDLGVAQNGNGALGRFRIPIKNLLSELDGER